MRAIRQYGEASGFNTSTSTLSPATVTTPVTTPSVTKKFLTNTSNFLTPVLASIIPTVILVIFL